MFIRAVRWWVWSGVWAAMGGLLTLELYLSLAQSDHEVSLGSVAFGQFMRVLLWSAFTPVVFRLQRMFPVSVRTAWWAVPLHVVFSVVAMALIYLTRLFIASLYYGDDLGWFWDMARHGFNGRNLIDVPIYWTVFGAGFTLGVVRRYRETQIRTAQLETDLAQAEMRALKAQLHPHFLFNTLNTISVLVRDGQNAEAVALITKLGALLRFTLDSTGHQEIMLEQELDFLRRYLDIQKARFSDRLVVKFEIDPVALEALLPNLILQPLVENAVIHGFARQTEGGCIEIAAGLQHSLLHIAVRDDGPGFPDDESRRREGIGLSNTRSRLAHAFGRDAQMILCNRPGGGAEVSIVMPFRRGHPAPGPVPAAGAFA